MFSSINNENIEITSNDNSQPILHSQCLICNKLYSQPKLLPCYHSFCEHCLREYITSRSYDFYGYFPCPVCHSGTFIPSGGANQFCNINILEDNNGNNVGNRNILKNSNTETSAGAFKINKINIHVHTPNKNDNIVASSLQDEKTKKTSIYPNFDKSPININLVSDKCIIGKFGLGSSDLNQPVGLTISSANIILVSDSKDNRIIFFDLLGNVIKSLSFIDKINSLIITHKNTLLLTNSDVNQPMILEYDMDGKRCGIKNTLNKMESTNGIGILREPMQIVVSSVETSSLFILDENGRLIRKLARKGLYGHPSHLTVNSKNHIVLSDRLNHMIKVINRYGKLKYSFGGLGTSNSNLLEPSGLCIDRAGNIIVADSGNRKVKCFDKTGKFICILFDCSTKSFSRSQHTRTNLENTSNMSSEDVVVERRFKESDNDLNNCEGGYYFKGNNKKIVQNENNYRDQINISNEDKFNEQLNRNTSVNDFWKPFDVALTNDERRLIVLMTGFKTACLEVLGYEQSKLSITENSNKRKVNLLCL